jgi:hypothetical protein
MSVQQQTKDYTMKNDDWNLADDVPPEYRTYVRMVGWKRSEILAVNPITPSAFGLLSKSDLDGAYVLVGTDAPRGLVEIRLKSGARWWVAETDVEQDQYAETIPVSVPHKYKDASASSSIEDAVIKALQSPKVMHAISRIIRQQLVLANNSNNVIDKFANEAMGYKVNWNPPKEPPQSWGF